MARASQLATIDQVVAALDQALIPHGFARQDRTFSRVTADGLVHLILIDLNAHADRFSRERRYAEFNVWLGVNVPEVAKHHDGLANYICKGCCLMERLEELSEPTMNGFSATADVIPDVLARLERDGLPLLISLSSRAALVAKCKTPESGEWRPLRPRVIAAVILAEQGATEEAKRLLAAQVAETDSVGHHEYVRSLASRLGIPLPP